MAIKVKAKSMLFHDGVRRRPGEVFILEGGRKPGKAMEVLGEVKAEPKVKAKPEKGGAKKEPETLSEMATAIAAESNQDLQ